MASPTKETQKAAYSIADSGENNTGTDKSKTSGRLFFSMPAAAACSPQTRMVPI